MNFLLNIFAVQYSIKVYTASTVFLFPYSTQYFIAFLFKPVQTSSESMLILGCFIDYNDIVLIT